uniref:Uncharacterized protein n=1 Tax=Rhipicephalus microplus TaxID=6941 RepID=A0A6G5AHD3_RHIMP
MRRCNTHSGTNDSNHIHSLTLFSVKENILTPLMVILWIVLHHYCPCTCELYYRCFGRFSDSRGTHSESMFVFSLFLTCAALFSLPPLPLMKRTAWLKWRLSHSSSSK